MTISDYYERANYIELDELFLEVVTDTEEVILSLNKKQLFESSISSKGIPLNLYQNYVYSLEKNRMNPLPGLGSPDLLYTGDFYRGFYLDADMSGFAPYSGDEKTSMLVEKYGQDIFGLTKQSVGSYVQEHFRQAFIAKIYSNLAS